MADVISIDEWPRCNTDAAIGVTVEVNLVRSPEKFYKNIGALVLVQIYERTSRDRGRNLFEEHEGDLYSQARP